MSMLSMDAIAVYEDMHEVWPLTAATFDASCQR